MPPFLYNTIKSWFTDSWFYPPICAPWFVVDESKSHLRSMTYHCFINHSQYLWQCKQSIGWCLCPASDCPPPHPPPMPTILNKLLSKISPNNLLYLGSSFLFTYILYNRARRTISFQNCPATQIYICQHHCVWSGH